MTNVLGHVGQHKGKEKQVWCTFEQKDIFSEL